MSALLPIEASELNINAEYGYSSRTFSKVPMVYQSHDYSSCLFLVYQQPEVIENRKSNYRNHFCLYVNDKSIVVARTETTLYHLDNDAIITYDYITPANSLEDRYRSKYKNWDVSFDKISYSNECPSLVGYRLICSGEWWFYDKGVILNGLTVYESKHMCMSIFIYYEFHIAHRVSKPNTTTIIEAASMQPCSQSNLAPIITKAPSLFSSIVASEEIPQNVFHHEAKSPSQNQQQKQQQHSGLHQSSQHPTQEHPAQKENIIISSIPSSALPLLNSVSRPTIRQNDTDVVPNVQCRAVMPSLYWLDERCSELCRGKIDYFLPMDYKR